MLPHEQLTLADLALEWTVEYETRLGMGWTEHDAERAANEHVAALKALSGGTKGKEHLMRGV